ncbi:MAG TPA: M20/M25/M40 family metallo-hydrolase, partial [Acidimicrobiales bacterium]|nr:M20/M25/M40 family metallo-hydrolase [Acidimicrobiales bacterium]
MSSGPTPASSAKDAAAAVVDDNLDALVALSHSVHDTPELCFGETVSAHAVAEAMRAGGLEVDEGVYDLPTAFESRAGSGDLVVAICAEYDALPEVGHACGHNIIAATAVGAGLALASVADELGLTVRVLGTPAEEGGGGKVLMLERGAFAGVHAAMMVHPWPNERLTATCLAVAHYDVHFSGRPAHASAAPWEGVNAQDALTVAQVAIGLLRQQLPPGDQVHGVVRDSTSAANVIPDAITARYMVRSRTAEGLAALRPRIDACFEAGAL